ncbi:MAG: ABC transporter substrate-binding protein, partial [Alphaproteobacteria bacterium]
MAFKRFLSRDKRKYVLPSERALGHDVHSYMPELSDQLFKGKIDRRDFLRQSALLGVSAGAAYVMADKLTGQSLIGAARADGHGTPKNGGVLRVSMPVQEVTDPASFSWTEPSNISRWMVEYLVRTGADNVTVPYLAEGWEASDDLKSWVFHLQKNVTWSNGDQFGADDVVAAITRWLDPETGSSN